MISSVYLWIGFHLLILALLILDLLLFHKQPHRVRCKEALLWSGFWIALSLLFNAFIYYIHGKELALQFFTGYLIEKSLSVDNLFVFGVVFSYFRIPAEFQHKVLYWGIIGALVFRLIFILLGTLLISAFHWIIYVLGALLAFTGIKLLLRREVVSIDPQNNIAVKLFCKLFPVQWQKTNSSFFIKANGRLYATQAFLALLVIESADILFAIDSVPAIFAISTEPFIVYTSNAFAILGLRSLYFVLAEFSEIFTFVKAGIAFILLFVGFKMLFSWILPIGVMMSLSITLGILLFSILLSIFWRNGRR